MYYIFGIVVCIYEFVYKTVRRYTDAAKIFVVCDVVAMFGIMLLTKFLVAKLSTSKTSPGPTEQLQPAK